MMKIILILFSSHFSHAFFASLNEGYLLDEQLAKSIGDKKSEITRRFIYLVLIFEKDNL